MLNYLRIFSWFLFTFGVVGAVVLLFGLVEVGGNRNATIGVMVMQSLVGGTIVYGFRLYKQGRMPRSTLLYSGWGGVFILIVLGQIAVSMVDIKL